MMVIGVDIGGTKIAAGVVDSETGTVLYSERTPTNAHEGGPAILARALAHAKQVVEAANVTIEAVGIGAGGQIDYRTGVVLSATDILPGWTGTRLAEVFTETFQVPAYADNDVNAFALGEHRFGAGRGATEAVFIALGTGVGGAIVTNSKLHRGKRGTGGELGHMFVAIWPEKSTFESVASGTSLVEAYYDSIEIKQQRSQVEPYDLLTEPVTGYSIGEVAKLHPNSLSGLIINRVGVQLGFACASLANVLDTERFIFGGGLADLGDLILDPARKIFAEHALPIFRNTPIVVAELGTNSSVVGAACVALTGLEAV